MDDRRDFLKKTLVASSLGLAGCSRILGDQKPEEIAAQMDETEEKLKSLSWDYLLNYEPGNLNLERERLQRTGVENASTYEIGVEFPLAEDSDDLEGWLRNGSAARRKEFFSLLNRTTYDVLSATVEDFERFHPENRPSSFNQVTRYRVRVDGDECSYLEDSVSSSATNDILASRDAYSEYVGDGSGYEVNTESAFLGIDYFCSF